MNDELKEILDALETQFEEFTTDYSLLLTIKQQKVLLDYITNLQQENQILKENAIHNDIVVDKVKWNDVLDILKGDSNE